MTIDEALGVATMLVHAGRAVHPAAWVDEAAAGNGKTLENFF